MSEKITLRDDSGNVITLEQVYGKDDTCFAELTFYPPGKSGTRYRVPHDNFVTLATMYLKQTKCMPDRNGYPYNSAAKGDTLEQT